MGSILQRAMSANNNTDTAVNNTIGDTSDDDDDDFVYVGTYDRTNLVPHEKIIISEDDDDVPPSVRQSLPYLPNLFGTNGTPHYHCVCPRVLQQVHM
jgi:hypothetical protein